MSDVLSSSATTTPITRAELKTHLNVSTSLDDGYIDDLITAAAEYVEERTNQCMIRQTRTLKMRGWDDPRYTHENRVTGDREIELPKGPVSSVTSVSYITSTGGTTTASTTGYVVTADSPARITNAYNNTWPVVRDQPDNITVVYVCGHGTTQSAVPMPMRHATKMLAAHWYRNRESVLTGTASKEIEHGVDSLLGYHTLENYG